MDRILVVGATGQLGTAAVHKLRAQGAEVRALVRTQANAARFRSLGVESVIGDLTDSASLASACEGVKVVVATANAAIPVRPADSFEAVERDGYRNLIQAASAARVRRFVFTSVPLSKYERLSAFLRYKRATEQALAASGLDYVIFRADIFMDIAFAMMGSAIPLRGSQSATVLRQFGFANRHFAGIKDSIENKRQALIPGDGTARHAFICVDDVAAFLASAASAGPSGAHAVGGPEALTFLDVVRIYERILGIELRVKRAPAAVFRVAATLLKPFSPAAANLMCLNWIAATENTLSDPEAASKFAVELTSAEQFLRARIAMTAFA